MGKEKFVISLIGLCLLTACQFDAGEDTSLLHESGNTINVSDRPELYNGEKVTKASNDKQGNFGYVRHQKAASQVIIALHIFLALTERRQQTLQAV